MCVAEAPSMDRCHSWITPVQVALCTNQQAPITNPEPVLLPRHTNAHLPARVQARDVRASGEGVPDVLKVGREATTHALRLDRMFRITRALE